jgi:uncharacterized OB-fold protein
MINLEQVWLESLQRGMLQIPQCHACGAWNWYPLPACRACHEMEFSWKRISLAASLYSWTRVHRSFSAQDIGTPYTVGLVEMADAPSVRLPCRIPDASSGGRPTIGAIGELSSVFDAGQWFWQFRSLAGP